MTRLEELKTRISVLERVVVAFSASAESAFLAHIAQDVLGKNDALAVTVLVPSLTDERHAQCAQLAREWELNWQAVEAKTPSLMDALVPIAKERSATVLLGVSLDDLHHIGAGQVDAIDRGALFPLVETGFTKLEVRMESHASGLETWNQNPTEARSADHGPVVTNVQLGRRD